MYGFWKGEECGDVRKVEEEQGGVQGRRIWRCSCRCGWSSRSRAAAGWSWGCCVGEEEEQVWELRRWKKCFLLEEQTSCQQQEVEEVCGRGQGPAESCDWRRSCCR